MEGKWWIDLRGNSVCDSKERIGIRKCFIHNINLIFYYIYDTAVLNCGRMKIKLVCIIETEVDFYVQYTCVGEKTKQNIEKKFWFF